jgi:hypothetical protein
MSITTLGTTEAALIIAFAVILVGVIAVWLVMRKRRTETLRQQFGDAEYARTIKEDGSRRHAEAELQGRAARVSGLNTTPLGASDRLRFEDTWRRVQARFVDGPGGAVTEADQLLGDVMSTRGYPVGDFEQRAADISVGHPLVLKNYRTAHEIAVRQTQGQANTEDLRQAMIHYRTLFEELVGVTELASAKAAS